MVVRCLLSVECLLLFGTGLCRLVLFVVYSLLLVVAYSVCFDVRCLMLVVGCLVVGCCCVLFAFGVVDEVVRACRLLVVC